MNQIQIITDAGSDIIDCSRPDLTVLPMTIRFGEEEYLDGVNLTHKQFYEKMIETQVLPTTSQPSPYAFETAIRKIHEQGDIALIITISSKLSGTWQSANIAAAETGGEVYIVDSLNVAVGEKAIVEYALRMKDAGTDIHTIVDTLNREKENLRVIALLDTLEYLQKGGSTVAKEIRTCYNRKRKDLPAANNVAAPVRSTRKGLMTMKIETQCLHEGYTPQNGQPLTLPIYQSTTYKYESTAQVAKLFDLTADGHMYSRISNPTVAAVEEKIAALEGGVGALCTTSGQAATLIAVLNILSAGDHILCSSTIYGGTINLLAVTLKRFGIETSFVDADADEDLS